MTRPTMTMETSHPRILVIEDDAEVGRVVSLRLEHAGFVARHEPTGRDGLRNFHETHPAAVVLDLGLPDIDGWHVLERIRDVATTPVLVLSGRTRESDKVRALHAGADDYITKPFGQQELVARVIAVLRRAGSDDEEATTYGDEHLSIDIPTRTVQVDGAEIVLTPGEFRLLLALTRNEGRVLSADQLLELAWDDPTHTNGARVRFTVLRLRRKLGWDDPSTSPIESIRGFGYRYRNGTERWASRSGWTSSTDGSAVRGP